MTPRNGSTEPGMGEFASSDAFLEALSRGDDPSGGADPLAAALLELKADIDRPLPPAPQLDAGQALAGNVASLKAARGAKRKRQLSPWLAGVIGAAAATVVCVGTGATLFDQGVRDDPAVVELATTLDELEIASQRGDEAATRDLLEQARGLVASMKDRGHRAVKGDDSEVVTTVTTVTTTVTSTATPSNSQTLDETTPEQEPDEPTPSQQPTQAPQTSAPPTQPAQTGQSGQPAQRPSTQPDRASAAGSPTPGSGATSAPATEAGTGSNTPAAPVQQPAQPVPAGGEGALRNMSSS